MNFEGKMAADSEWGPVLGEDPVPVVVSVVGGGVGLHVHLVLHHVHPGLAGGDAGGGHLKLLHIGVASTEN